VCAAAGMSGALRVTGNPGGAIYFADGLVVAIETPGAPSPEVLLLRSHRVTESGWDAAFAAAAAAGRPMSAEFVARQLVGSGELEILLRTAVADAIFVLASGTVEEYRAEPGQAEFMLLLQPGAETDWLLAEASRRIRVLATLPARHARDRIVAAPAMLADRVQLGDGQDEILALADGRRTTRDIAFALGRGVYATTLALARMREAGQLVTASSPAAPERPGPGLGHPVPPLPLGLPRRERDLPAPQRRHRLPNRASDLRAPLNLLRPRSTRDPGSLRHDQGTDTRGRGCMTEDKLLIEMQALRDRVAGITGTAVASRDGLIIREDTGGVNPDNLAALTATSLALAQRLASEAGQGTLREAVTKSSGGYVAIYAVGAAAVLVLLGDEGLDITRLHRESRGAVDSIEALLA